MQVTVWVLLVLFKSEIGGGSETVVYDSEARCAVVANKFLTDPERQFQYVAGVACKKSTHYIGR